MLASTLRRLRKAAIRRMPRSCGKNPQLWYAARMVGAVVAETARPPEWFSATVPVGRADVSGGSAREALVSTAFTRWRRSPSPMPYRRDDSWRFLLRSAAI